MTLGIILLGAIVLLTFLGLTQRVFDRMHLTDSRALLFVGLLIAGSFITIQLTGGTRREFGRNCPGDSGVLYSQKGGFP